MAEGGVPLEPESEGPEVEVDEPLAHENIHSPHLIFTRDIITYVMRRQVPFWTFGLQYGTPCPVTPFSYRIRHAVEFYLVKESINIYNLFSKAFERQPMDYFGFNKVIHHEIFTFFRQVTSHNELLRLLCIYAHFALLAYKRGVEMAPYHALTNIQDLLHIYISKQNLEDEYFYGILGFGAENLIHEPSDIDLNNLFEPQL